MKRILVTGAGGASGLSTIKLLKRTTNHYVIAADSNKNASGFLLADENVTLPNANEENFIECFINLIKEKNIDLVLPNVDDELKKISSANIPEVLLSEAATIGVCSDKLKTLQCLKDIIEIPQIFENIELINEYPVFLKPRISRGSRNTYIVKNLQHLLNLIEVLKFDGFNFEDLLITEYLSGQEYTVECLFDKTGNLLIAVPRKRIKTDGAVCTVGEIVKDKKINEIIEKISKKIKFVGPINIQLKEDRFGILKILEINPRIAGSTPMIYSAGVNIPKLSSKVFFEQEIEQSEKEYNSIIVHRILEEC